MLPIVKELNNDKQYRLVWFTGKFKLPQIMVANFSEVCVLNAFQEAAHTVHSLLCTPNKESVYICYRNLSYCIGKNKNYNCEMQKTLLILLDIRKHAEKNYKIACN